MSKNICKHKNYVTGYDFLTCKDCGWVYPDTLHLRSVGMLNAPHEEQWFPSEEAFFMFKKTGIKCWISDNTKEINNLRNQLAEAKEQLAAERARYDVLVESIANIRAHVNNPVCNTSAQHNKEEQ